VQGVLFSAVDVNWFSAKYIANLKVLKTGYAFLFDEKGVVIAHPVKARIQTKIGDFDWGRKLLSMKTGRLTYSFGGTEKESAFKTSETLGWGCAVTAPGAEVDAPAYQLGKVVLLLGLACLIASISIMLWVSRSITRPLEKLSTSFPPALTRPPPPPIRSLPRASL